MTINLEEKRKKHADYMRTWRKNNPKKTREQARKWKEQNPERVKEYKRLWNLKHGDKKNRWNREHPEQAEEARRRFRSKNPGRNVVYCRVQRRIKNGDVKRPGRCSQCGITGTLIEGHHVDYNKPYDLRWLCHPCHMGLHRGGKS
jgi:hypothetical protein